MSCTPMNSPPIIPLPAGVSITPPAPPPIPADLTLCCKLIQFGVVLPPLPFPPLILAAPSISAAISLFLKGITDYLDSLPLICPKE